VLAVAFAAASQDAPRQSPRYGEVCRLACDMAGSATDTNERALAAAAIITIIAAAAVGTGGFARHAVPRRGVLRLNAVSRRT
jgi:hypothetical protein